MSDCPHEFWEREASAADGYCALCMADDNKRLRTALREMIEISKRNSEATLMLVAIRKCAEHALKK